MSKLLSNIVFTFLLLFQTTATAEEGSTPIEASVEEMEVQETEVPEKYQQRQSMKNPKQK